MLRNKFVLGFALVLALLALQVGVAYAATVPDGTIVSVTEISGGYEVVVTDSSNQTQTVDLTVQEAVAAGLVQDNGDGTFTIIGMTGDTIVGGVLVPAEAPKDACATAEGGNPVAGALSSFFCDAGLLGGTDTIDSLHGDGFGYGEIAQACFMAESLGDGTTCGDLLQAKKDGSLGDFGFKNWGDVVKGVLAGGDKSMTNLGAIMSGRATPPTPEPTVEPTLAPTEAAPLNLSTDTGTNSHGNGHGHGGDKGNHGGNGKGGGHGH